MAMILEREQPAREEEDIFGLNVHTAEATGVDLHGVFRLYRVTSAAVGARAASNWPTTTPNSSAENLRKTRKIGKLRTRPNRHRIVVTGN
jgi:hypothetical protein